MQQPAPVQQVAPMQAASPMFGAAPPAGASSGQAKLGFAAALYGFSADDLGFNPAMVPAWITTQVPASTLKEQIASGSVVMELGMLIDGITDVGFRNTLSTAKRSLQVKLPQNEVFHALTGSASTPAAAPVGATGFSAQPPAPAQTAPSFNSFVIQPGAPNGQVSRVEPAPTPALVAQSPSPFASITPSVPLAPEQAFGAGANPFARLAEAAVAPAQGGAQSLGFSPFTGEVAQEASKAPAFAPSVFPPAPPVAAPASTPLQPLAGSFQLFGTPPSAVVAPAASPTSALGAVTKPFDPFASSASPTGALPATPSADSGFSSAQLLGQTAALASLPAFSTPPVQDSRPLENPFAAQAPVPAARPAFVPEPFAPALEQKPVAPEASWAPPPVSAPAPRPVFDVPSPVPSVPLFSEPAPQPRSAPVESKPAAAAAKMSAVKHSFLGLAPLDTQTDQLLLRALLGTEENLTAPRVVELLAAQAGLSACVCLHGSHVLSHADKTNADAAEFQRQAPEIAHQLRGLAPLIGIEGAETFTLNAGGRLLTFCFPSGTTVGVLHDDEPSNGLRDKITLIARELARMLG